MYIRSNTWGRADLSWSVVMEELLYASQNIGNTVHLLSTNGTDGMKYWDQQRHIADIEAERNMKVLKKPYDIDICFTVPENFPKRFLNTSKVKMACLDYESSILPKRWTPYYQIIDFILPGSQYVADMIKKNGCPEEKIKVIPHGIDIDIFNPNVEPVKLPTEKKFKFLCIAAPHYRKQIDKLLTIYCKTFKNTDDVSLILKTKIFKPGEQMKGFEMDLRVHLAELKNKYGASLPEIKIINYRINNIASLYTACNSFVLMSASEGFGIPYLEALACGLPTIAPRHGGQLDFLNDNNSLLCDTETRLARPQEQYWGCSLGAIVGAPNEEHFCMLMKQVYNNCESIRLQLAPGMKSTAEQFTWKSAAEKVINIAKQTGRIGTI